MSMMRSPDAGYSESLSDCWYAIASFRFFFFFFQAEDGIRDVAVTGGSDVCSSDLHRAREGDRAVARQVPGPETRSRSPPLAFPGWGTRRRLAGPAPRFPLPTPKGGGVHSGGEGDRKSVVWGKRCRSRWSPYH